MRRKPGLRRKPSLAPPPGESAALDTPIAKPAISYRSTIYACYLGNFVQAVIVNVTPILFIPLRDQFGLTFEQMGRLVLVNFFTQVLVDLIFSKPVDKYGVRPFVVTAQVLAVVGLGLFAAAPRLFADPYLGFTIATIIFSGSGGLLELLLSPIVNAIPTPEKASAMSLLHSFYSWGQVTVVLVTTLLVLTLGGNNWFWIVLMWMVLPLINTFLFAKVPLAPTVSEAQRTKLRFLLRNKFFLLAVAAILLGGAAEVTMAQWASSFMEKALDLPKILGDVAGVCMFALMMGIGRATFGKYGGRLPLYQVMTGGALLAGLCYLVIVISPFPWVSLAACAVCGLAVSLLWPGSVVIAAERFPLAGASMFALLAAGGDTGASVGPWLVGWVADLAPTLGLGNLQLTAEQLGLRAGLLAGSIFPFLLVFVLIWLKRHKKMQV